MYPSVTKILGKTKDKKGLESWRASVGEAEADRIIQEAFKRGRLLDENVQLYADQNQSNNALLDDFLEPYTIKSTEQQVVSEKYCYYLKNTAMRAVMMLYWLEMVLPTSMTLKRPLSQRN
jgi:hypothetical protein